MTGDDQANSQAQQRPTVAGMNDVADNTDKVALVVVDAGWLIPQAVASTMGSFGVSRERIDVNTPDLVTVLIEQAQALTELPCHRVLWFDGAREGHEPTAEHARLMNDPRVELSLGPLRLQGSHWVQKRVDAMIQRDITFAALSGRVGQIVLVAGDEDLAVAAETATEAGVPVRMLIPENSGHRFEGWLARSCTDVNFLPRAELARTVRLQGSVRPGAATSAIAQVLAASA